MPSSGDLESSAAIDPESVTGADVNNGLDDVDADIRPAATIKPSADDASTDINSEAASAPRSLSDVLSETRFEQEPEKPDVLVSSASARQAVFEFNWQQLSSLNWWQWVQHLPLAGMPMAIALNSALIDIQGQTVWMDVDPQQGALFNDSQRQRIEVALSDASGEAISLVMQVLLPRGETPHQRRVRLQAECLVEAEQAIVDDECVQGLVQEFEAHIIAGSIRPRASV